MYLSRGYFIFVFAVLISISAALDCKTNPSFEDKNKAELFFDQCFLDTTHANVFGQSAKQLQTWFNESTYPIYILVSLMVLLFCVIKEIRGNTDIARYNFIRLQGLLLLIRVGLAISITPWMVSAIRQQRPCFCSYDDGKTYNLYIQGWGMPAGITFASTIVAMHFIEALSIPIGIIWMLIMWAVSIASGQYSFGQGMVGIVLGVVLHFYSTRTPMFLRIIDFFITLIAGFTIIFLAMKDYPLMDFSFAANFLVGLCWQIYAFIMLWVAFESDFMKKALRKSVHTLHDVDFLYFRPLTSHVSVDADDAPPFSTEAIWTVVITSILFIVLCGLQVLAPFLNDIDVK